ncbi:RNA-directed DNA polymerase, eukaryota, reverse transcriptase zinc-binding domain protein, partial [Tanacetum coccineum]
MANNTSGYYDRRWKGGTNWRKNTDREKQTVENQEQSKENNGMTWNKVNKKQEYRKKQTEEKVAEKGKNVSNNEGNKGKWELNNKEFQAMKKSANKYSILNSLLEDDPVELDMLKGRMIADQYLNKKVQPSKEEISKWSLDMVGYFKMKWNEARIKGWVEEDILSDNEVENVIANEIAKKVKDVCGKVFGDWEWITNSHLNINSCRIMVCWNPQYVRNYVIQVARQSILCHIKELQGKNSFFCTFVYASNNRIERKELWKDMYLHKKICGSQPWAIMGDMNATLNIEEHSSGGSFVTDEMQEFRDCKLDRVMVSDKFLDAFEGSHAIFQPFLISDHSPAILTIPTTEIKKAKSF